MAAIKIIAAIVAKNHILNLFPLYNFQKMNPERETVAIKPLREYVSSTAVTVIPMAQRKNSRFHPRRVRKKNMEIGNNSVSTAAKSLGFCNMDPQPEMRWPNACP